MKMKNVQILRNVIFLIALQIFCSCGIMRKKLTIHTFNKIENKSDSLYYNPIIWTKDSVGGRLIEKSAFFIPVNINGLDKEVYMQFDLGANITLLYGNTLNSFIVKNPELSSKLLTNKEKSYFTNTQINLNSNISLTADKIRILNNFGSDKIDSSFTVIGTIGFDIIGDNILILDFKKNQYALTASIPSYLEPNIQFVKKADLRNFPVIIPFKLGKRNIRLMFDTGSSMFPIITGTNRIRKIAKGKNIDTLCCISAWGIEHKFYRVEKSETLWLDSVNLGKIDIYGYDQMNKMKIVGNYLFGITGNTIFENSILVIDRKNNRFGILK